MIPASALLREASRYSHTLGCVVDVYDNGVLTVPNVPVIDGSLKADRDQKERLNCDLTLALNSWESVGINPFSCRFEVRRGVTSLGVAETMKLGSFRVDDVERKSVGEISLKGAGLEAYVVDARFLRPRTPPWGADTVGTIRTLIREALPAANVRALNTTNRIIKATSPWERERWDDGIEALADSINAEVFADHTGDFVIADVPQITTGAQVMWFDEGDGQLTVSCTEKSTRDQVYNAVSVAGSSSDPNIPPVWAAAYDLDPNSPTYYWGPFGQVPRFYTSQFFTTVTQCQVYATELLAQSLAANDSLKFTSLPLDFLEVGDLVGVRHSDGTAKTHLIQSLDSDLGTGGGLVCDTLSSKVIAREDDL